MACALLGSWENIKKESRVKKHGFCLTFTVGLLMLTLLATSLQLGIFGAQAHAKESHANSKVISDTLAAHKITCLSRNGWIMTVLLDGKWVEVREVELIDRTLILRTNAGILSLATVLNN